MSAEYELSKTDRSKWVRNLKRFSAPMLIVYVSQLMVTIRLEGHVMTVADLLPNTLTQGTIMGYLLSAALDLFTKWQSET